MTESPGQPPPPWPRRRPGTARAPRRREIGVVAVVIAGLVGGCTSPTTPPRAAPTVDAALAPAAASWTALPPAPLAGGPRIGQSTAWTGSRAVVWGGGEVDPRCSGIPAHDDGAVLDPASGTWQAMPPSPLSARTAAQAHWTGTSVIFIGGQQAAPRPDSAWGCTVVDLLDGASYDPDSGQWELVPPVPLPAGARIVTSQWTGEELLVWAGREGAAAYDPTTSTWRTLAAPPQPTTGLPQDWDAPDAPRPLHTDGVQQVSASSVWTGQQWLIWAQVIDEEYRATAWSLSYSPGDDAWQPIANGPAVGSSERHWDGQRVLALDVEGAPDGDLGGRQATVDAYEPDTGTWTTGPPAPQPLHRSSSAPGAQLVVDGRLVTWDVAVEVPSDCPDTADCVDLQQQVTYAYAAAAPPPQRWQALEAGPWESLRAPGVLAMGSSVLVTGGTAGRWEDGSVITSGPALPAGLLTPP